MKEKLIKLILGLIQFLVDFNIIACALGAFGILIAAACSLVDPRYFFGSLTAATALQYFIGVVVAVLAFFNLIGIHRLLDNLNSEKYFVAANCRALSCIFWTTLAITILDALTTAWLHLAHLKPALDFITLDQSARVFAATYVVILLIIYLIFKRGIALQNDVDSII